MKSTSSIPILSEQLTPYLSPANLQLTKTSYRPLKGFRQGNGESWTTLLGSQQVEQEVSIVNTIKVVICKDALLIGENANAVLHALRMGSCLGAYLADQYSQASGLEAFKLRESKRDSLSALTGAEAAEKNQKNGTAGAIALFVMSAYVVWKLGSLLDSKADSMQMEQPAVPETVLTSAIASTKCALYYYGFYLEKSGLVRNEMELVKITSLYFQQVMKEVQSRVPSLRFTEAFTEVSYRLKDTEFAIDGFKEPSSAILPKVVAQRVEFGRIVGNHAAKHTIQRVVDRLCCYDPIAGANPFSRFGGVISSAMGCGKPGTGKTLLGSAASTLLSDRCDQIGLPYRFHELPVALISSYQGDTDRNMSAYFEPFYDKSGILLGLLDDCEGIFLNRAFPHVSEGQRAAIKVYLTKTEGASAPRLGNSLMLFLTNMPDQIDPAVMSRQQLRFKIEGAETEADFADQMRMGVETYDKVDPKFVGLADMSGYRFLEAQKQRTLAAQLAESVELTDDRLIKLEKDARASYSLDNLGYFATLFKLLLGAYPQFSSRDVRNIMVAADSRVMDFDLPGEWFTNLDLFFAKDFESKVEILKKYIRECMGNVSYPQILRQEVVKYLNVFVTMENTAFQRKVDQRLEEFKVHQAATAAFEKFVGK